MKKIQVKTVAYTAKAYAEADKRSFFNKNIHRYRHDVFPEPESFGLRILAVAADIVEDVNSIYTHRLLVTVYFSDEADDGRIARYKAAMEQKAKRYDIAKRPERKSQEDTQPEPISIGEEPIQQAPAEESQAEAPAEVPTESQNEDPKQDQQPEDQDSKAQPESKKKRSKKEKKSEEPIEQTIENQVTDEEVKARVEERMADK